MIAPTAPLTPAPARAGPAVDGASAETAASAFALLITPLLPVPAAPLGLRLQPAAETGSGTITGVGALPGAGTAVTPAAGAAGLNGSAMSPGAAEPPPVGGLPEVSQGIVRGAITQPVTGDACGALALAPAAVPATDLETPLLAEVPGAAAARSMVERPPLAAGIVAAPPGAGGQAVSPTAPPEAPIVTAPAPAEPTDPTSATVSTPQPPLGAGDSGAAPDTPPVPANRTPTAASELPTVGAEPTESAPASEAATPDPSVELGDVPAHRAARPVSEPPVASPRAAPPPPPVQLGMQIASAATRRVERIRRDQRADPVVLAEVEPDLDPTERRRLELNDQHRQPPGGGASQLAPGSTPSVASEEVRPPRWFVFERILDIRI